MVERYRPVKQSVKKWKAGHAPTIDNVCTMQCRMERIQREAQKIRQRWLDAPELAALYVERKGAIPFYFAPRAQTASVRLVVDNTQRKPIRQRARGPRCA